MRHSRSIALWLLCAAMLTASSPAFAMPSLSEARLSPTVAVSASKFAQAAQPATPKAPQPATAAAVSNSSGNDEPVGNVVTLTGTATLTRNNASTSAQAQGRHLQE